MSETELVCPKCNLPLPDGTVYCPKDHGVTGGVHGVDREAIDRTPRSKRDLLGVTINDAYAINGFLGSGGFGAVYSAEQKTLGRDVALKLLMIDMVGDDSVIQRFKREARTAAALLDPNIVTLFDYGEAALSKAEGDQVLYIAMELVHGPTLRQVLKKKRRRGLPLNVALKISLNILSGLAAAHQLGVVHRDLKPGNVLIDESKNRSYFARLFDFGIASLQGSGGHTTKMGQGGVLGTPKYMAPEQWRAQQTAPCTDIYAFGVMLAEMLLGHPPIPKMDLVEMAAAHCRDSRPAIVETARGEDVPKALTNFIKKCMAIDPRQRYGTAREALDVLRKIDEHRHNAPIPTVSSHPQPGTGDPSRDSFSVSVPPPPPPPPSVETPFDFIPATPEPEAIEPRRIWPWVLGGIGIVLIGVGIGVINAISKTSEPLPQVGKTSPQTATAVVPVLDDVDMMTTIDVGPPPDAAVIDAMLFEDIVLVQKDAATKPLVAAEPPKPKKVAAKVPKLAKVQAPKPTSAIEPTPKPAESVVAVAPKAKPAITDREAAELDYMRARDAEQRGAPKSAQRFYASALRKGLQGKKAADAQRRIRRIADQTALEASEF